MEQLIVRNYLATASGRTQQSFFNIQQLALCIRTSVMRAPFRRNAYQSGDSTPSKACANHVPNGFNVYIGVERWIASTRGVHLSQIKEHMVGGLSNNRAEPILSCGALMLHKLPLHVATDFFLPCGQDSMLVSMRFDGLLGLSAT